MSSFRGLRASVVLALVVGAAVFTPGLLLRGDPKADWFFPSFSMLAITLLVVTAALGSLDATLRRDSRSLPVILLAAFGLVAWIAHLAAFVAISPASGGEGSPLARWIFAVITVSTPAILALTLLHWPSSLERPVASVMRAALAGLGLGLLGVVVAVGLTGLFPASAQQLLQVAMGCLGLLSVAGGLGLLVSGHRGDERIASGVAAGLVVSAFASAGLIAQTATDLPMWYATEILAALPFAALLAGQLSIYERSVRSERASEARLRAIFEGSAMGIALLDGRGRMIEVNSKTEEITGYDRGELRGTVFADILARPLTPAEQAAFGEMRRGLRSELETDVCMRTKAGQERWLRLIVSRFPSASPGGPYFVAMGHDITEQRRFQAELEDASQRLATAERMRGGVELVSELASSLDPAQIARRFVKRAVAAIDADRCTLFRTTGDGMIAEASFDGWRELPWVGRGFQMDYMLSQPLVRAALESRQAVLGGPLELDDLTRGYGDLISGVRHTAVLPLLVGDEVAGLLIISRLADPAFSAEDLDILRLIGSVAALALHNARIYAGAKEASMAKTLFLNMAAHELRTPLTVVLGYLSLLLEGTLGPPSDAWRPTIELLEAKTRELGGLVDGILVAASLEEGPIGLTLDRLDVQAVLESAVRRIQPRARLSRSEVQLEMPATGLGVQAHRESLDRILDNLLNNAILYSPPAGMVQIRAAGINGSVAITVTDQGVGIPVDMRERIFERLVRLDQPRLGYPPGSGLGLYISRSLAERMNGSLVLASSTPGQGSTFELRLPVAHPEERRRRRRRAPAVRRA